jgi:hypothetical protein
MAQITIKGLKAIENMQDQAKEIVSNELTDYFTEMANFAITKSPIWSGAYVKSFSFKSNNSRSRGRRVDGANWRFPKKTGSEADRETGRDLLLGDVKAAFANKDEVTKQSSFTLRNDSNHARFVEYGVEGGAHPPGPRPKNGYRIFSELRRKYG